MPILKTYKNGILKYLLDNNINTLAFVFKEDPEIIDDQTRETFRITHNKTQFSFTIIQALKRYTHFKIFYNEFKPGNPVSGLEPDTWEYEYSQVLNAFKNWFNRDLNPMIEELDSPDILQAIINPRNLINVNEIDFNSNSLFEQEEIRVLRMGLDEIKNLISDRMKLTNSELSIINDRIDYLSEGIERLSKTDWKNILISTIISIITTLT